MNRVLIKNGTYGHGHKERVINNVTFPLAKKYTENNAGKKFITVVGTKAAGLEDRNCQIKVDGTSCFEYLDEAGNHAEPEVVGMSAEEEFAASESDAEAMERIGNTFEILNELTDAASQGIIRGMVVSGPPGIGKSYGVEKTLEKANFALSLAGKEPNFEIIKGAASAIGLYKRLYLNRKKGFVTILDDMDSVLYDEQSLNLLKAALDTCDTRRMSWLTETKALEKEDIPDTFEYEGSIIFLTNIDFERTKASKIAAHLQAIMSRCHYVDLEISSLRDQLLRIKQVVACGMLNDYALSEDEKTEVVDYVMDNAPYLREISLRIVIKIASLAEAYKKQAVRSHWKDLAEMSCLKRSAKFERLLKK